jgi:hypothetical protein
MKQWIDLWMMNWKEGSYWKFKIHSWHLYRGTWKTHENPQDSQSLKQGHEGAVTITL